MKVTHRQWLYHPTGGSKLFDEGEDAAGWYDTPDKFPQVKNDSKRPDKKRAKAARSV